MYTADDLLDDDEISDDGPGVISQVGLASSTAQDYEDEARSIVARAGNKARSVLTINDDVTLPFRVPREIDPSIWSVRVKVGVLHCL